MQNYEKISIITRKILFFNCGGHFGAGSGKAPNSRNEALARGTFAIKDNRRKIDMVKY